MARPIKGAALVDGLDGSEEAKLRLKVILETVAGKQTIVEACEELGISPSRFHALREQVLQSMVHGLETKAPGRPPKAADPAELEALLEEQRRRNEELLLEQRIANVREEIRMVFPDLVVEDEEDEDDKKKPRKTTRRWKPTRKERKKRR